MSSYINASYPNGFADASWRHEAPPEVKDYSGSSDFELESVDLPSGRCVGVMGEISWTSFYDDPVIFFENINEAVEFGDGSCAIKFHDLSPDDCDFLWEYVAKKWKDGWFE